MQGTHSTQAAAVATRRTQTHGTIHVPVGGRRGVERLGDDVPGVVQERRVPFLELRLAPVQLGDDGLVKELDIWGRKREG